MSSNFGGAVEIMNIANSRFTNAQDGDMVIYTKSTSQSLHLGVGTDVSSAIKVTNSNVTFNTRNVNLNSKFSTYGLTRIDEHGYLQNIAILPTSYSVNIDAGRLTSGTVNVTRLPQATPVNAGIVRLSNSLNSMSSNMAATPYAVKMAYDVSSNLLAKIKGVTASNITMVQDIDAANITSGVISYDRLPFSSIESPGIVQLEDSYNSDNTSNAPTCAALKAVYETTMNLVSFQFSNLQQATPDTMGIVQLTNAYDSISETLVPSALALRNAYISATVPATTEQEGRVRLSDSVTAFDSSTAATSAAVKLLNDISVAASNIAVSAFDTSFIAFIDGKAASNLAVNASNIAYEAIQKATTASNISAASIILATTASNIAYDALSTSQDAYVVATSLVDASRISTGTLSNERLRVADTVGTFGITTLSDSFTSASSLIAATSKAVKDTYDLATIANNTALSNIHASRITNGVINTTQLPIASIIAQGIVTLSDATSLANSDIAATSKAVKDTYDLATIANNNALSNIHASRITNGVINNAQLPIASTIAQGIVTLSDATFSANSDIAATSKAVKDTYDLATIANNNALSNIHASRITNGVINNAQLPIASTIAQGIVTLSDATSLANSDIAATSKAVKDTYDLATIANNNALSNIHASRITDGVINNAQLPIASIIAQGIVTLSDATSLANSDIAATSKAVKDTYDLATIANNNALSNIHASRITNGVINNAQLPIASTIAQGIVTLSDATSSANSDIAATSKAVKDTYDLATIANNNALSNIHASRITNGVINNAQLPIASTITQGIVQLSDSITSTNTNIAATSKAVKIAYDRAVQGGAMTGPILGYQGSSNAPSFAFSNDATTGMYQSGNNMMGFALGGTPILVIDKTAGTTMQGSLQINGLRISN